MDELIRKCFTHIDDLRKIDPDYFKPNTEEMPVEIPEPSQFKNSVMILEEGSQLIYGEATKCNLLRQEGSLSAPEFIMQCQVRNWTTEGKGKTKKLAKHAACAEMLKLLIKNNLHYAKDFGIPHTSYEAAEAYIKQLVENVSGPTLVLENNSDFDGAINYIGMVQEMCQKHKIDSPIEYVDRNVGNPQDSKFIIGHMVSEGEGKKKKDAKVLAAYKMSKIIKEAIDDLNKNFENLVLFDEDAENAAEFTDFPVYSAIVNPVKCLEEILGNKSKFISYETIYRDLRKFCDFSLAQVILTVKYVLVGQAQETTRDFPGVGDNYESARERAAINAIRQLETL